MPTKSKETDEMKKDGDKDRYQTAVTDGESFEKRLAADTLGLEDVATAFDEEMATTT